LLQPTSKHKKFLCLHKTSFEEVGKNIRLKKYFQVHKALTNVITTLNNEIDLKKNTFSDKVGEQK
jgi:hypothetical protein